MSGVPPIVMIVISVIYLLAILATTLAPYRLCKEETNTQSDAYKAAQAFIVIGIFLLISTTGSIAFMI